MLLEVLGEFPVARVARFIGGERCNQLLLVECIYSVAPALPHRLSCSVNIVGIYLVGSFVISLFTLEHL